jgi:hypothetical protein
VWLVLNANGSLKGADLTGVPLRTVEQVRRVLAAGGSLRGADLQRAQLRKADLRNVDLEGANLSHAHLGGARLDGVHLDKANLSGADLSNAHLEAAQLTGANLTGADLSGAHLSQANLDGADLHNARLEGADLGQASLKGADLRGARLQGAILRQATLTGALRLRPGQPGLGLMSGAAPAARSRPAEVGGRLDGTQLFVDEFALALVLGGEDLSKVQWMRRPNDTVEFLEPLRLAPALPPDSQREFLDRVFNHWGNAGRSALASIDSIDQAQIGLKRALMGEVCEYLKALPPATLAALAGPVWEILSKYPEVLQYHPDLAKRLIGTAVLAAGRDTWQIDYLSEHPTVLHTAVAQTLQDLTQDNGGAFAAAHGMAIYQMLRVLEKSSNADDKKLAEQLRAAYEERQPANANLKAILASARSDNETMKNSFALPLGGNSFLLLDHDRFDQLVPGPSPRSPSTGRELEAWSPLALLDKEGVRIAGPPDRRLLPPLLAVELDKAHLKANCIKELGGVIQLLSLGSFGAACLAGLDVRGDFNGPPEVLNQEDLGGIFGKVVEMKTGLDGGPTWVLTPGHILQLNAIYGFGIPDTADPQKPLDPRLAPRLLGLAAAFARYSSRWMFGAEVDSPPAVRGYAAALIETASHLQPALLDEGTKHSWREGLRTGKAGPATVYQDISRFLRKLDEQPGQQLYAQAIPSAWQSG